ncbi:uncharacterized protein PHA67_015797 [Liasis olivaceus]
MRPSTTGLLVSLLAAWLWALPASAQRPQVSESESSSSSSSSEEQRVTVLRPPGRLPLPPPPRRPGSAVWLGAEGPCQQGGLSRWVSLSFPVPKCPLRARGQVLPCGSTCSSSAKCPGSELCCKYGCHQECLLPVDVNPGYCPKAEPLGTSTCATNCTTDAKCGEGKKCCRWGCFSSCVDAEPAHPGVCPAASALPETDTCGDACDDDRDCPPWQKCCLTGCRRECTELEQGLCSLPKDPGSCASRLDVFYYDATTATCEAFKYSGCKGNANRFYTKAECLQVCRRLDVCQLLVDPGPCSAHHPRFYYNPQNKTCEKFTYGGCGGNGNRFETQMECIWKCRNPDICRLPKNPGEGDRSVSMYRYDPFRKACEIFAYKGQKGNPNRFATLVECQETCRDPDLCQLPVKVGPCEALLPRFHYDATRQMCTRFYYGGCQGNLNNFGTQEGCLLTCKGPEKPGCCPPTDRSSCLVSCQKDCQCPGARKCCSSQCGQQCMDPVEGCNKRNLKYP